MQLSFTYNTFSFIVSAICVIFLGGYLAEDAFTVETFSMPSFKTSMQVCLFICALAYSVSYLKHRKKHTAMNIHIPHNGFIFISAAVSTLILGYFLILTALETTAISRPSFETSMQVCLFVLFLAYAASYLKHRKSQKTTA